MVRPEARRRVRCRVKGSCGVACAWLELALAAVARICSSCSVVPLAECILFQLPQRCTISRHTSDIPLSLSPRAAPQYSGALSIGKVMPSKKGGSKEREPSKLGRRAPWSGAEQIGFARPHSGRFDMNSTLICFSRGQIRHYVETILKFRWLIRGSSNLHVK